MVKLLPDNHQTNIKLKAEDFIDYMQLRIDYLSAETDEARTQVKAEYMDCINEVGMTVSDAMRRVQQFADVTKHLQSELAYETDADKELLLETITTYQRSLFKLQSRIGLCQHQDDLYISQLNAFAALDAYTIAALGFYDVLLHIRQDANAIGIISKHLESAQHLPQMGYTLGALPLWAFSTFVFGGGAENIGDVLLVALSGAVPITAMARKGMQNKVQAISVVIWDRLQKAAAAMHVAEHTSSEEMLGAIINALDTHSALVDADIQQVSDSVHNAVDCIILSEVRNVRLIKNSELEQAEKRDLQ